MTNELHKAAIKLGRAAYRMPALAPVPLLRRLPLRPRQTAGGHAHAGLAPAGQTSLGQVLTAHHAAVRRAAARPFQPHSLWQPLWHGRIMAHINRAAGRDAAVPRLRRVMPANARPALLATALKKLKARQAPVRTAAFVQSVRQYLDKATGLSRLMKFQKQNVHGTAHRRMAASIAVSQYRAPQPVAMRLNSLAPLSRISRGLPPELKPSRHGAMAAEERTQPQPDAAEVRPSALTRQSDLARDLESLLARQARLPPRGMTGFDPRLTPAWAGLKLPN